MIAAVLVLALAAGPACDLGAVKWMFASRAEGERRLSSSDGFARALSEFDRESRVRKAKADSAAYLAFAGSQAIEWTEAQKTQLRKAACDLSAKLAAKKWALPAIDDLVLIATTGKEEGHAAYTRGHAIIFPSNIIEEGVPADLLAHEFFHVLSRELMNKNPKARDALYAAIDFEPLGAPLVIPDDVHAREITNPDAYAATHGIKLKLVAPKYETYSEKKIEDGKEIMAVPFLMSRTKWNPESEKEFFGYLVFVIVPIEKKNGSWALVADEKGNPIWYSMTDTDYGSHVRPNTQEVFAADELLAADFAIALGYKLRFNLDPVVPAKLSAALSKLK